MFSNWRAELSFCILMFVLRGSQLSSLFMMEFSHTWVSEEHALDIVTFFLCIMISYIAEKAVDDRTRFAVLFIISV